MSLSSIAPTMSSMIFLHMWKYIKNIHIKYGNPFKYYYPNKPVTEHAFFNYSMFKTRNGYETEKKKENYKPYITSLIIFPRPCQSYFLMLYFSVGLELETGIKKLTEHVGETSLLKVH